LLRCGSAFALSLPSLGVSSLDLGRLFTQAALFSFGLSFGMRRRRRPGISTVLLAGDSGFALARVPE
jgi:hypothetical protein